MYVHMQPLGVYLIYIHWPLSIVRTLACAFIAVKSPVSLYMCYNIM